MAARPFRQLRTAVGRSVRATRALCAPGALVALVLGSGTVPCPARADEAVPAAAVSAKKTHKQTETIAVTTSNERAKLADFCLAPDGTVLALVAGIGSEEPAERSLAADAAAGNGTAEVRVYDREGKPRGKWPVDFAAEAINVALDGVIYIGGRGRLARYTATGEQSAVVDAPQVVLLKNPEELRERAKEQLELERTAYGEQIKQWEAQLKRLEARAKEQPKPSQAGDKPDQLTEPNLKAMLTSQIEMFRKRQDRTVDEVAAELTSRLKTINSLAIGERDVFIACPGAKGYGYSVWRTNRDFQEPLEIITGLNGCCGQMDIQTRDGEVFVAENSRHRVARFDRDGKRQKSFGSRDREGAGEGFGGCCNPMNLCFTAGGELLAAESNGLVKQFTLDGGFVGLVGIADVPQGCKNSAISISSDGDRLYYIDIQRSAIIMLAQQE